MGFGRKLPEAMTGVVPHLAQVRRPSVEGDQLLPQRAALPLSNSWKAPSTQCTMAESADSILQQEGDREKGPPSDLRESVILKAPDDSAGEKEAEAEI